MRAILLLALLLASCGGLGPTLTCDESGFRATMSCEELLDAAREQLAEVDGITQLSAVEGVPCPRDAAVSCPDVPAGTVWTVYADLADGRVLAVRIVSENGSLSADPPFDIQDIVNP
jgi:hypothetical protein